MYQVINFAPALGLFFDVEGLICVGIVALIVFLATATRKASHRCPRCHEINREAAVFCAQCGTRLPGK